MKNTFFGDEVAVLVGALNQSDVARVCRSISVLAPSIDELTRSFAVVVSAARMNPPRLSADAYSALDSFLLACEPFVEVPRWSTGRR